MMSNNNKPEMPVEEITDELETVKEETDNPSPLDLIREADLPDDVTVEIITGRSTDRQILNIRGPNRHLISVGSRTDVDCDCDDTIGAECQTDVVDRHTTVAPTADLDDLPDSVKASKVAIGVVTLD